MLDLHGVRGLSAELLTKEELERAFPTPETLVGPVYRAGARMYGRDLTNPIAVSVLRTALHIIKAYREGRNLAAVRQMWSNIPAHAHEVQVSAGSAPTYPHAVRASTASCAFASSVPFHVQHFTNSCIDGQTNTYPCCTPPAAGGLINFTLLRKCMLVM